LSYLGYDVRFKFIYDDGEEKKNILNDDDILINYILELIAILHIEKTALNIDSEEKRRLKITKKRLIREIEIILVEWVRLEDEGK
jgi:hypothetical protein